MARTLLKKIKVLTPPVRETSESVNRLWLSKANSMRENPQVDTVRVKLPGKK